MDYILDVLKMLSVSIIGLFLPLLVHELGHFFTAKFFKVKANIFSIGMFGIKIFKRKCADTFFILRLFPIGGSVKFNNTSINKADSFHVAIIAFAGSFVNIILALIIACYFYFNQEMLTYILIRSGSTEENINVWKMFITFLLNFNFYDFNHYLVSNLIFSTFAILNLFPTGLKKADGDIVLNYISIKLREKEFPIIINRLLALFLWLYLLYILFWMPIN